MSKCVVFSSRTHEISKSRMLCWRLSKTKTSRLGDASRRCPRLRRSRRSPRRRRRRRRRNRAVRYVRDHRWDGERELVKSGGVSHFAGTWLPACWARAAGGGREDDEPAPKKLHVYRSFQKTSWLALLPWLFVVAGDSAIACTRAGVGCPGGADCSKVVCLQCMPRLTGPCE